MLLGQEYIGNVKEIKQLYEREKAAVSLTSGEWEQPIPFELVNIPEFPTESLPSPVAAYVEALAESTQTPEEMASILSLGILSTAFQSRYDIEITSDWKEQLSLYSVAIAPPGERKTAVISGLTAPVYEYEAQRRELEAVSVAKNQAQKSLLERQLSYKQTMAAKDKASEEEVLELAAQLSNFKELYPFRLLVDDTTPEKLIDIMDAQSGCITVASAEGGVFDGLAGRYDKGANFDIYLKGHAGDPITVDRIGRKSNYIQKPRLTMMLTIQPEVLNGLMSNATFKGRGLCGRFLYAMCKSKAGNRDINPDTVPEQIKVNYRNFILRILSGEDRGTIRLSGEANNLRLEYAAIVEKRLGDEWEHMKDWGGKLLGAMLRIAALIHASETGNPAEMPMSSETLTAAIKIAECLSTHAMAAYQIMGSDETLEDAKYLWKRIKKANITEISQRDLFNVCKGKFKRVDAMEPALHSLIDMGYIRLNELKTGGRPTIKIIVNPMSKSIKSSKSN